MALVRRSSWEEARLVVEVDRHVDPTTNLTSEPSLV